MSNLSLSDNCQQGIEECTVLVTKGSVMAQSRQVNDQQPTPAPSEEREHLGKLAGELSRYEVRAEVVEESGLCLRVGNPASVHAVEDVICERREHDYAFIASFGVHLGNSGSLSLTAHKIAWLVGATKE